MTEWEDQIVSIIKTQLNIRDVQSFPDDPDAYGRTYRKHLVLVGLVGESRSEPEAGRQHMGRVAQTTRHNFEITLCSNSLRGTYGIYDMVDKIRLALQGFRLSDLHSFMFEIGWNYVDFKAPQWIYKMNIACTSVTR